MYNFSLNTVDKYDDELPLVKNQAYGGTMVVWRKSHDAYITIHPVSTPSFLPIIFTPPGCPVSVHVALYFPTSGKENEFIEQLCLLRVTVEELQEKYPDSLLFLRGDSNVNPNNKQRLTIFNDFLNHFNLISVPINHKTYHHFLGDGQFDSEIDVIAVPVSLQTCEKVTSVICSRECSEVDSHHDIIVTSLTLPDLPEDIPDKLVTAPRVPNNRRRVIWSDDGVSRYQALVSSRLSHLRNNWCSSSSPSSFSVLLKATNEVLDYSAAETKEYSQQAQTSPFTKRCQNCFQ